MRKTKRYKQEHQRNSELSWSKGNRLLHNFVPFERGVRERRAASIILDELSWVDQAVVLVPLSTNSLDTHRNLNMLRSPEIFRANTAQLTHPTIPNPAPLFSLIVESLITQ